MSDYPDYGSGGAPAAHHLTHENSGSDKIDLGNLSGELADEQKSTWTKVSNKPTTFPPESHKTSHEKDGADEINVE